MARRFLVPVQLPGDPSSALYAAPKQYVDTAVATRQAADPDLTAFAALAPADGSVLRRISGAWSTSTLAQIKTDLALSKADVGLSNVTNTADSAKPVSTDQQAALDLKANRALSVRTVTTTGSVLDADDVLLCDTTSAAFTVTLPTAVGRTGRAFLIKKIGANALTIATTSSQVIDGGPATTEVISVTQGFREVVSDNSGWRIRGGRVDPVIFTNGSNITNGGSITPNSAQATVYRYTTTGATATLNPPTGGPVDGDVVNLEIYANGSALALTVAAGTSPNNIILTGGITSSISVGSGKLLSLALRYRAVAPIGWRLLASSVDG